MERPIARFAVAALLGLIASFSISFGFIAAVAAFAAVLLFGIAWKSYAALSGGLCAFGLTWLVFGVDTSLACSRTEDFCGRANVVPFIGIALAIAIAGVVVGAIGIARDRAKRHSLRA